MEQKLAIKDIGDWVDSDGDVVHIFAAEYTRATVSMASEVIHDPLKDAVEQCINTKF